MNYLEAIDQMTNDIGLRKLQSDVKEWSTKNFPDAKPHQPLLGAAEEIGELCHAHLKMEQNIRTNQNHKEDAEDAIADCIIYLADYCWRNGYDLQTAINKVWPKVQQRDWIKNQINGEQE
jgi:NTP pyrophosphatase (non-canonical NTP hydrolase)